MWPRGWGGGGHFWPQNHYLSKLGKVHLSDATHQISRFYALWFKARRLLFLCFPYISLDVKHVTPVAKWPQGYNLNSHGRGPLGVLWSNTTRQTFNDCNSWPWAYGFRWLMIIFCLTSIIFENFLKYSRNVVLPLPILPSTQTWKINKTYMYITDLKWRGGNNANRTKYDCMCESSKFPKSWTFLNQILKLAVCLQISTISSLNGQLS